MKWYIALIYLVSVAPSLATTIVEAYDRIYAYVVYDLDTTVWGVGKRYIAPKCLGSRADKSCTFNEFINFIEIGEASPTPAYYTLDGTYYFTPSTLVALSTALRDALKNPQPWWENLVSSRKSHTGIWNDLGFVVDQASSVAPQRDVEIGRHLQNAEMVMGAISLSRSSAINTKTLAELRTNVKNVLWEITQKETVYLQNKWDEVDWDKMVKKWPDLTNPSSTLFKDVTKQLRTIHSNNAGEMTVKRKVMDSVHLCFGN
ncbi:hypothetical protein B0J13DRAFT_637920 [Dactylonectria estremocensis]|uniref:Uncharacterized protein n=1 Tax=Dactylonectria estremocensis TaxID=1079267 RepID=A0A9P9J359_9HYPO|nr:hypothetical protein B0J13DRAFT_637920 [Dactylonectria estremocensis]